MIGVIEFYRDPVLIDVPRVVKRGEEFAISVTTYGGGCVAMGEMNVKVAGLSGVITPYDWVVTRLPPNEACTDQLGLYRHTSGLRFDERGTARITIVGRRIPQGEVFTVQRRLEVR